MRLWVGVLSCVLAAGLGLSAQDAWKTNDILGTMDLSALTAAQKQTAIKVLREHDCSCQCGMKVAECMQKDPNCSYSKSMAAMTVKAVVEGKSVAEIVKMLDAAPKAQRAKVLEDPVTIPVKGSPARGPLDAKITIVEFSDFECPYCAVAVGEVAQIMAAYPNQIRLIYKQFPLSMHPHAPLAAAASLAANEQGKFWEMHDVLFANFRKLSRENILTWAAGMHLNMDKFKADLDSGKYTAVIHQDVADGEAVGIYGTPAFFINGKHYNGPMVLDVVKPYIEAELKGGIGTKSVAVR